MYLLAQFCGILGTLVTILQPQAKTKVWLSLGSGLTNLLNGLNFALLGQTGSSMLLCLVAVIQAGCSVAHEKSGRPASPWEAGLFGVLYVAAGVLGLATGTNPISFLDFLPILGALMLMASLSVRGAQKTRFFLLLNSLCWLFYTAMVGSTVFFSCLASMLSSLLALWKYRKR